MTHDHDEPLLSTGEFARRTRLTIKALRIYEQNGLLPPHHVDQATGYRRYGVAQVRTGRLIGLLRAADLGLADISGVLTEAAVSVQRRLHAPDTDAFVAEHLGSMAAIGPFTLIFHGIVDEDRDGPIEAYTTITKAQWAYPAILAAYDAVACSAQTTERSGSRLSCREVYRAGPDDVSEDDLLCDVAFPLA